MGENNKITYGYIRVSSKSQARDGNSLEVQEEAVRTAGATVVVKDVYTGTTVNRPALDELIKDIHSGDTLIVTKLDRVARSVQQGIELIDSLAEKGVTIKILNMGTLDNSPTGKLIRNVMLCFAEFERDMIMQRTREGKEIARQNPDYHEGPNRKYSDAQLKHALSLLGMNSYSEVERMTGISKSTLIRAKKNIDMRRGE